MPYRHKLIYLVRFTARFTSYSWGIMYIVRVIFMYISCRARPKSSHSTGKQAVTSKKPSGKDESSIEDMMKLENLLDDRIQLANTISVLEDETEDSQWCTSVTEDILPEGNEELSSGKY